MASSGFAVAILALTLAGAAAEVWPGGKLREALKTHSPFKHQEHPLKDPEPVVAHHSASASGASASSLPTVTKSGAVLLVSRKFLDGLQNDGPHSMNNLIQEATHGSWPLTPKEFNADGSKLEQKTELSQIKVRSMRIDASGNKHSGSEIHMNVELGFNAKVNLFNKSTGFTKRGLNILDAQLAPMGNLDLTFRSAPGSKMQLELVSSDIRFKEFGVDATTKKSLRFLSKNGVEGQQPHMDLAELLAQDSTRKWFANQTEALKPKFVQFLNERLTAFPAQKIQISQDGKMLTARPSVQALTAMHDGGLAIAADVDAGETCDEPYPELPLDRKVGEQGEAKMFMAIRVLNCALKELHSSALLKYKGSTNFVETSMHGHPEALMLAARVRRETRSNPFEKLDIATTSAPHCSSSPSDGLTCNFRFTLAMEQQLGENPTFEGEANVGMDLAIEEKSGEVQVVPRVSKCKVDFDLEKGSVHRMGARAMFKGMASTLPPMACALVPQLMKKVPKIKLGSEFLGSTVAFEDGYVALSTSVNPFKLKDFGGSNEWGSADTGDVVQMRQDSRRELAHVQPHQVMSAQDSGAIEIDLGTNVR